MSKKLVLLMGFILATFWLTAANAEETIYSDRGEFDAAVTATAEVNLDFEEVGAIGEKLQHYNYGPGVVYFTSPSAPDCSAELLMFCGTDGVAIQDYPSGTSNLAIGGINRAGSIQNGLSVLLTFSTPVIAFGFDNLDLTTNPIEYAIIKVTFSDDTPPATYTVNDTDADVESAEFFGIVALI